MLIQIRYFAQLREEKECSEELVFLSSPCSLEQLFEQIFARKPVGIRFALDQSYVSSTTILGEGIEASFREAEEDCQNLYSAADVEAEVAFLPPLGGG